MLHAILDGSSATASAEPGTYSDLEAVAARLGSNKLAGPSLSSHSPKSGIAGSQLHTNTSNTNTHTSQAQISSADSPQPHTSSMSAAHDGHGSSRGGSGDGSQAEWQISTRKRTLFAGYVSFAQIQDFLAGSRNKSIFDLLGSGNSTHKDKVIMTGPGGVGRAEVAVAKLDRGALVSADQHATSSQPAALQQDGSSGSNPVLQGVQQQQGSLPRQGFLSRARQMASGLQKAVADLNGSVGGVPNCKMQCALMLLKLPVTYLAQELLDGA